MPDWDYQRHAFKIKNKLRVLSLDLFRIVSLKIRKEEIKHSSSKGIRIKQDTSGFWYHTKDFYANLFFIH